MKRFLQIAAFVLVLAAAIPVVGATETKCTGDAARLTPPVPNYPTHIRNVIWRNKRTMCQNHTSTTNPSAQTQSQKQ
jgi:hypothetical protein